MEDIAAYIEADCAINALAVVERIEARAESLTTMPRRGRIVPELRWHGITAFQELIERPWRIVYQIQGEKVGVVAVLDGRRELEDLLLGRLVRA